MKELWLCADDYAQNADISAGIRDLYTQQHINAISCMTNMPLWSKEGQELVTLHDQGYLGLHLNFTEGYALSEAWRSRYGQKFHPLWWMIVHRLDCNIVLEECIAQLEAFHQIIGRMPDFIDGHQHVHQFPCIADMLLPLLVKERFQGIVRVSAHERRWAFSLKSMVIAILGGRRLRRLLKEQGIACNTSFAGIYSFGNAPDYRDYFKSFLTHSVDQGLIMCHPGRVSTDHADPLHAFRHHELVYLQSDVLLTDLQQHDFVLKRKEMYAKNHSSR